MVALRGLPAAQGRVRVTLADRLAKVAVIGRAAARLEQVVAFGPVIRAHGAFLV